MAGNTYKHSEQNYNEKWKEEEIKCTLATLMPWN